jgi:hypothetical protein
MIKVRIKSKNYMFERMTYFIISHLFFFICSLVFFPAGAIHVPVIDIDKCKLSWVL